MKRGTAIVLLLALPAAAVTFAVALRLREAAGGPPR